MSGVADKLAHFIITTGSGCAAVGSDAIDAAHHIVMVGGIAIEADAGAAVSIKGLQTPVDGISVLGQYLIQYIFGDVEFRCAGFSVWAVVHTARIVN